MVEKLDFFWDVGSTNSYFALKLLTPLAATYGVEIAYRPLNLGYVFRRHNYVLMEEPAAKIENRITDLMRWARRYDLPFKVPEVFPIKTSRALRGSIATSAACSGDASLRRCGCCASSASRPSRSARRASRWSRASSVVRIA